MRPSFASTKARPVPEAHRSNFNHLVYDIAWFGVLNGSAIAFVAVYAARLGADAFQLGLLNAVPALVILTFALPAGSWLRDKPVGRATVLTSIGQRWFYLVWVFLPLLFVPSGQITALLVTTLLMSIPGTALAISFNALFAAAVPPEWRAQVAGARNAAFALSSIAVTLACGFLLDALPFPLGYQVVFFIGFVGAMMSTVHLAYIKVDDRPRASTKMLVRLRDWAQPGIDQMWTSARTMVGLRFLSRRQERGGSPRSSLVPLRDHRYQGVLLIVFALHLTLYLAVPLFPLMMVSEIGLSDSEIGWGNSLFYVAIFLGSLRLHSVNERLGYRKTIALGLMIISFYPTFLAMAENVWLFLAASLAGGLGWSLVGGALGNYVLAETPDDKRPAYLAWYNMALQAGILGGSLLAPVLAGFWSIPAALLFAAAARFVTGVFIWRGSEAAGEKPIPSKQASD